MTHTDELVLIGAVASVACVAMNVASVFLMAWMIDVHKRAVRDDDDTIQ